MPPTLDALLSSLEAAKSRVGNGASAPTEFLLDRLSRYEFREAKPLIRFHETLLFLRAFPQSRLLVRRIEKLLNAFHTRIEKLRELGFDRAAFDDFDTSGIAGTSMQDTLSFDAARWLVRRIPRDVEIAWDDYEEERAMDRRGRALFHCCWKTPTWKPTSRGGSGSILPGDASATSSG